MKNDDEQKTADLRTYRNEVVAKAIQILDHIHDPDVPYAGDGELRLRLDQARAEIKELQSEIFALNRKIRTQGSLAICNRYNWIAVDKSGEIWAFKEKPNLNEDGEWTRGNRTLVEFFGEVDGNWAAENFEHSLRQVDSGNYQSALDKYFGINEVDGSNTKNPDGSCISWCGDNHCDENSCVNRFRYTVGVDPATPDEAVIRDPTMSKIEELIESIGTTAFMDDREVKVCLPLYVAAIMEQYAEWYAEEHRLNILAAIQVNDNGEGFVPAGYIKIRKLPEHE